MFIVSQLPTTDCQPYIGSLKYIAACTFFSATCCFNDVLLQEFTSF